MEADIINTIQFKISGPTVFDFFELFALIAGLGKLKPEVKK